MESLTDMWANWVAEDRTKTQQDEDLSDPFSLPLKYVEYSCLPEMKKQGYCLPTRRALGSTPESGLEALPAETNYRGQATVTMCTLWHFVEPLVAAHMRIHRGPTQRYGTYLALRAGRAP